MDRMNLFAGLLEYTPCFDLADDLRDELGALLVERGVLSNHNVDDITIDWIYCDGSVCSQVALLHYYSEDGSPAFIYYRIDSRGSDVVNRCVHIPDAFMQETLVSCYLWRNPEPGMSFRLQMLNNYTDQIMNDPSKWEEFHPLDRGARVA